MSRQAIMKLIETYNATIAGFEKFYKAREGR